MLLVLKIVCLSCLIAIVAQDFRERLVYTWLFICVGILMSLFYFFETTIFMYLLNIGVNIGTLIIILGILHLYAKFKIGQPLNQVLGLGDILFFIMIAISFPIPIFFVLFSFSLIFGLLLFLLLKPKLKEKNVPLAGLQALFFTLVLSLNWMFKFTNLYMY